MHIWTPLVVIVLLTLLPARAVDAQIADPLPTSIDKRGLMVEIRDVVRLPKTLGLLHADQDVDPAGWARVSFVRDAPDGRRFANDSRGFLYLLEGGDRPTLYLDFVAAFPFAIYSRLESGFIGFDFHPEFARNGLFYTVHGEYAAGNPAIPDFIPPGFTPSDVTHHNVITEWRANDPIERFKTLALAEALLSEEEIAKIEKDTADAIDEAVKFAQESPDPEMGSLHDNVYA